MPGHRIKMPVPGRARAGREPSSVLGRVTHAGGDLDLDMAGQHPGLKLPARVRFALAAPGSCLKKIPGPLPAPVERAKRVDGQEVDQLGPRAGRREEVSESLSISSMRTPCSSM